MNKAAKKNYTKLWIAILLLFLVWIPLLNIAVILQAAIYLVISQIILIKKHPEKYGGMVLAIVCLIASIVIFALSLYGLITSISNP